MTKGILLAATLALLAALIAADLVLGPQPASGQLDARHAAMKSRAPGPRLFCEEPVFDWGTLDEGAELRHTYRFTNTGSETVRIERARTSCGCGAFDFTREIPPGGEGQLSFLIPGDKIKPGSLRATITLTTNAKGDDILVARGNVAPRR